MENNERVGEDKLTKEFLAALLSREDVSSDDKIAQILAEHSAYNRGLVQKRNELLESERKLKTQISTYGTEKEGLEKKISELDEALKKASSEDNRNYYEAQISDNKKKYEAELQKIVTDRDFYKSEYLKNLRNIAIEKGTESLHFVPGLKQGFIARVLEINNFQPKEIEGEGLKFLNDDHHTIEEAINSFALTQEGKAYIANPSTGGGARGSGSTLDFRSGKQITSQQLDTMSDEQIMEFAKKGGQVV